MAVFLVVKLCTLVHNLKSLSISDYTFCTRKLLLMISFKVTGFIRNKQLYKIVYFPQNHNYDAQNLKRLFIGPFSTRVHQPKVM